MVNGHNPTHLLLKYISTQLFPTHALHIGMQTDIQNKPRELS